MERLQSLLSETDPDRLAVGGGAVALILLVIWWLARRRGGGSGRGPERQEAKLGKPVMPESESVYRLLADHSELSAFPDQFLRELSARLRKRDNVVGFIALAEKYRLLGGSLRGLAKSDAGAARTRIAAALAEQCGRHPEDAQQLMQFAARIDHDNLRVSLSLALDHFDAGRYQEALPLLERAIPACRRNLEEAAGSGAADMQQLLEKSMDMYETCLDRGAG